MFALSLDGINEGTAQAASSSSNSNGHIEWWYLYLNFRNDEVLGHGINRQDLHIYASTGRKANLRVPPSSNGHELVLGRARPRNGRPGPRKSVELSSAITDFQGLLILRGCSVKHNARWITFHST